MRAAHDYVTRLGESGVLTNVYRLQTELYGSLALTGHGHGTDRAILLGLSGELPDQVDPVTIALKLAEIRDGKRLLLAGTQAVDFEDARDMLFHRDQTLAAHSNGMRFTAYGEGGRKLDSQVYYSIGGGFIRREGETAKSNAKAPVPYPFTSAKELLRLCDENKLAIWELTLANERAWHSEEEIREKLHLIWRTMDECIERGLKTEGILPGGLNVRRRAAGLSRKLALHGGEAPTLASRTWGTERGNDGDPLAAMDWVNAFAMAVNEENAAGSRVVTAPTNGAAGIIPAVGRYYLQFVESGCRTLPHKGACEDNFDSSFDGLLRYLLTAGAIAILYKENASISGAEVGCQGEVGVACSMAAAGLTAALGGTNHQIEFAAEIGMEHNLGMTCDPIGGLVQIPCIERNAMGAVKAINASRLAMQEDGEHKVSLDQVIETMYQTGLDMQSRYKETSLAGLALNVINC